MGFFEKDLRVKITAIMVVIIILALGSALVISQVLVNRILGENIENSMAEATYLTRDLLEVALERRRTRVELLVNTLEADPDMGPDEMASVADTYMQYWPVGAGAMVLDSNGNVLNRTEGLGRLDNATGTSWFEDAQSGKVAFTYVDGQEELTQLDIASPTLAVSAPLSGSRHLVIFTTISDIWKAINSVETKGSGHAFLIDEEDVIIAGHAFTRAAKAPGEEAGEAGLLLEDFNWGRPDIAYTTIDFEGTDYLVSYTTVARPSINDEKLDWAIGIIVPSGEAYAPARLLAWSLIGLTAIILLGAVIATVLLSMSITRPINELVASAEKIGSGDLTGEVVIRTRDQIGTLAAALLRMRDYLRNALGEAGYSAKRTSMLAEEQSAATGDMLENTEEIADSVVVLARNMDVQTRKLRTIMEQIEGLSEKPTRREIGDIEELLRESEILSEVGANKTVEIASASQEQRAAARDIAAAARRLSVMSSELKEMVRRFKT